MLWQHRRHSVVTKVVTVLTANPCPSPILRQTRGGHVLASSAQHHRAGGLTSWLRNVSIGMGKRLLWPRLQNTCACTCLCECTHARTHVTWFLRLSHTTALHRTAPHCATPHRTALHCTAPHCIAVYYTALHRTALHRTAPHCTALHCITLRYTALLHCVVL